MYLMLTLGHQIKFHSACVTVAAFDTSWSSMCGALYGRLTPRFDCMCLTWFFFTLSTRTILVDKLCKIYSKHSYLRNNASFHPLSTHTHRSIYSIVLFLFSSSNWSSHLCLCATPIFSTFIHHISFISSTTCQHRHIIKYFIFFHFLFKHIAFFSSRFQL